MLKKLEQGQKLSRLDLQQVGFALVFFFALNTLFLVSKSWALPGQHSFGIGAGQILLLSDYAKTYDNSIGFNGIYEYDASTLFGVSVRGHYSSHLATGTTTAPANPADSLSLLGITPNLKVNFAYVDKLILYGLAGFGLFKVDKTKMPQTASVTTFGFNLGVGFDLPLVPNFKFGTSLSFHNIFDKTDPTSQTSSLPALGVGGTYMNLMLNAFYVY